MLSFQDNLFYRAKSHESSDSFAWVARKKKSRAESNFYLLAVASIPSLW